MTCSAPGPSTVSAAGSSRILGGGSSNWCAARLCRRSQARCGSRSSATCSQLGGIELRLQGPILARMRLSRRFLTLIALLALLHLYIGLRLLSPLPIGATGQVVGWLALLASCLMMPLAVFARAARDSQWSDRFAWIGLTTMGLLSSLMVFTLLRDVVLLIARAFMAASQMLAFERLTAIATIVVAVLATLIGVFNARRRARGRVDVPIADLPAALHGFTIAQISDIHVGPTIKRDFVEAHRRRGERARCRHGRDHRRPRRRQRARPRARTPRRSRASRRATARYFVTGNHEYYSGAQAWIGELRRLGHARADQRARRARARRRAARRRRRHRLQRASLRSGASQRSAARAAGRAARRGREGAARAPAALGARRRSGRLRPAALGPHARRPVLAVEFLRAPAAAVHRGAAPLGATCGSTSSRGTGYWGPPMRFGAPSEITRIRLVPA